MKKEYAHIGKISIRTIEECAELIHILCKVERFGWKNYHPADLHMTPNFELVKEEIKDLQICLDELQKEMSH